MNQQVADTVRSLPPILQDTWILGCFYLVLSVLAYLYFIRPALWRYIRANTAHKVIQSYLERPLSRVFFTAVAKTRKRAAPFPMLPVCFTAAAACSRTCC